MEYFIHRYPGIFSEIDMDQLSEEFLSYQMLSSEAIPKSVKESVNLDDKDPHCVDVLWGYLRGMKQPGTNDLLLGLLFKVAEVVMTIPHSNAGKERIFSPINNPSSSSLQLNGTLSSLRHTSVILEWTPSFEKAKVATRAHNEQHKS